ncbi:MAG: hypothetical protein WCO06_00575 [Candidatus Roizmanbacteria bacterium]
MARKFNHRTFWIKFFALGIATVLGLGMATAIITTPAYGPISRASNECPLADFKIAMGTTQGKKNFNVNLDVDGDHQITATDFQIICNGSTHSE